MTRVWRRPPWAKPEDKPPTADGFAAEAPNRATVQWVDGAVVYGSLTMISEVQGDVSISDGQRPLYYLSTPTPSKSIAVQEARLQPSKLLHPRYEVVDFVGRTTELLRLEDWRDSARAAAVMLMHGPSGQGKSRLAAHFTRASERAGWQVLHARHGDEVIAPPFEGRLTPQPHSAPDRDGLLVVADYAERWPTRDLVRMVLDSARQRRRTRVLLLSRPAGVWWRTVAYNISASDVSSEDLMLSPLLNQSIDRREVFALARDRFAEALDVPNTRQISAPSTLDLPEFDHVLAVHMAALAAVDAWQRGEHAPDDPGRISAYLLDREMAYWHALHSNGADSLHSEPRTMRRVVFVAALTRALPHDQGIRAIDVTAIASTPEGANRVLTDHSTCYPPSDPSMVLEPLHPNRLSEDFLGLTIPGHSHGAVHAPDSWAIEAIGGLLTSRPPAPIWTRSAMTVLIETAARWPHVASKCLAPLLGTHPELAAHIVGSAAARLAELTDIDHDVLSGVASHLRKKRKADLDSEIAIDALGDRLRGDGGQTTAPAPSKAQQRTSRRLKRLSRSGFRMMNSWRIPGTDDRVDHLVIGPTGVFLVLSMSWDRRLAVRTQSRSGLTHGPFSQRPQLDEARRLARETGRLVNEKLGFDVPIRPSLAIYGPVIPWNVLEIDNVDVYQANRIARYLSKRSVSLGAKEIDQIHRAVRNTLLP
ncbi:NERD domain-containing protein [Herbidospora daliensis]|uniref:NERD domain-containing protein n=1 Tax=Herbidospora daliensis TaxID=295585 RepID=UPI000AB7772E|nr:NERD domain-containing protein [Herbidospora daliensis]